MATRTEYRERLAALKAEDESDRPPIGDYPPEQEAWRVRKWHRQHQITELTEALEFVSAEEDPCPLASDGLEDFLSWQKRKTNKDRNGLKLASSPPDTEDSRSAGT